MPPLGIFPKSALTIHLAAVARNLLLLLTVTSAVNLAPTIRAEDAIKLDGEGDDGEDRSVLRRLPAPPNVEQKSVMSPFRTGPSLGPPLSERKSELLSRRLPESGPKPSSGPPSSSPAEEILPRGISLTPHLDLGVEVSLEHVDGAHDRTFDGTDKDPCTTCGHDQCCCDDCWDWRLLPDGLIFTSYLAGARESRISCFWFHEQDIGANWDITLGGRVGILRYGTAHNYMPEGWQLDVEGAAFPRLDQNDGLRDMAATDFRFGVPITYGEGPYQMKIAYYHLSSHLGDELLLRLPNTPRINYTRDAIVWGHSYYIWPELRIYGEIGYSLRVNGGAEPWELQFGAEYAPCCPTGAAGAPFWAVNFHLREEVDFGGSFVLQTGWAWRGRYSGHLLRAGLQYYNGKSPQYEFFNDHEEQIGIAMWYDY